MLYRSRHSIVDTAATPAWPDQPFVQPLATRVSSGVNFAKSGLSYNAGSKIYTGQVTVTNTSTVAIKLPLKLVIEDLASSITLVNSAGTYYGQPYVKLSATLAPGSSATVQVQFKNSANTSINYTPAAYTGGV